MTSDFDSRVQEFKYGDDPRQVIGLYCYNPAYSNLSSIVFIHGGAWVDERNSYHDWTVMASYIKAHEPHRNIFGLNYRLLPHVKHPSHVFDIYQALMFLSRTLLCASFLLVGHLVGATLALQMLATKSLLGDIAHPLPFTLEKLVLLDGIYSVPDLLQEYPSYSSFVNKAFSSPEQYQLASPVSSSQVLLDSSSSPFITVVYSLEDELLSPKQTALLVKFLRHHGIPHCSVEGNWGMHDDMYKRDEVCKLVLNAICD